VRGQSGAALRLSDGSISCPACTPPAERTALLPAAVLDLLAGDAPAPGALPGLGAAEKRRITRLLAAFCQHHFEMRATYRALDFLCEML
jgi:hypothetical protein